jgi:aryl-alcohol dehydrogenase-like predicted oxidoreductase
MTQKLPTRPLGKTGFNVSLMGYGCSGYWGYSWFDEKQAFGLIDSALEAGVNYFDTGPEYSLGNAEIRLGKALEHADKSKLLIASKVGTVRDGHKVRKDFSPATMRMQIERSLERLKLDQLPLLNLHSPKPEHFTEELFEALTMFKKEGLIKWLGISAEGKSVPLAMQRKGVDVLMLPYNVIEQELDRTLHTAKEQGFGTIIKGPLCRTLYSDNIFKIRGMKDFWYILRVLKSYRKQFWQGRKMRFINHVEGYQNHAIALRFALHDAASCVVSSTTNPANLIKNIEALQTELPQDLIEKIKSQK